MWQSFIHQCQGNLHNPPQKIRAVGTCLEIQLRKRKNELPFMQLHYSSLQLLSYNS